MEILSYIASLAATFFGICAPFWKSIKIVLCCNFLTNVLTGISYILVGGYSGAIPTVEISSCLYTIVTLFTIAIKIFKKLAEKTAPRIAMPL